ncbi:MAG: rhomboid family intramembrane serine protease [Clostridia bacterium]|nr:rhomboid family intramembrane serine protease [Clostridia bacterium]
MSEFDRQQYAEQRRPHFNMKKPTVTYVLIGINLLMYILMTAIGYINDWGQNLQLILFGAKVNELIDVGQVWRLLTCVFLHVGIAHLICNCYAIYVYGPVVERLFGKARFLTIYIVGGIMGSLMSYAFSDAASAGASGAIFGLIGCMFYFREKYPDIFRRIFGKSLFIILGLNLLFGFIQPGIDNFGHIGGFIGGFVSAWVVGLLGEYVMPFKRIFAALVLAMIATGFFAVGVIF